MHHLALQTVAEEFPQGFICILYTRDLKVRCALCIGLAQEHEC